MDVSLLPKSSGEIVKHTYYTLCYSEEHEQALWVYYILSPSFITNDAVERVDNFRADPKVQTGSATPEDYKSSGYDRGHLCPAADMKLNNNAMSETFYMSNMSPQSPYFNRGIWKQLEAQVRSWGLREKKLHVVTGPIFKDNKGNIGKNRVTIPGYYYKVIYDPTDAPKMIAFLLPNEKSALQIEPFVVSVDSVEQLTQIDFFPELADSIETLLEKKSDFFLWDNVTSNTLLKNNSESKGSSSTTLEIDKKVDDNTYKLTDSEEKGGYTNSKGEKIQKPAYYRSHPMGATALCNDGTYSFSKSRRGTCSHHGGVKRWL